MEENPTQYSCGEAGKASTGYLDGSGSGYGSSHPSGYGYGDGDGSGYGSAFGDGTGCGAGYNCDPNEEQE